ncbi:Coenzyme F420 hydrogenase/dehydrogenase, beta subunit C-terminal domain (plasmid) [Ensifer adhaerens]|nr:Coenzyme F420 hydrogenase/dehydrogenase, beta subunit C-terminal domain [Ensifer adhaerens]UAY05617.1 Coenzyme F420 hydrogenase/dehydrogenase, beta subunit C-terminal domain [Ensifer adhaerens]UAY12995.1 Coenzyme F420 hydrogenase/dehydrogenase, beta subunit C-terminal domain [Ensifer adhaerens]
MRYDRLGQIKPLAAGYVPGFGELCSFSPHASNEDDIASSLFQAPRFINPLIGRFEAAFVGHVREGRFRAHGSSGGMASWAAAELLKRGMVDGVAHVVPRLTPGVPLFEYAVSRSALEVCSGAKSRYYPVELSRIIREIRQRPGRYAVTGIPCFIKALHLLAKQDPLIKERLTFTLGLFCGHMKSARFAESLVWQMGEQMEGVAALDFRLKDTARPANWYAAHLRLRNGGVKRLDWWHLADGDWGAGFFQNSACNFCDDVVAETADISFGDAWVEPYSSDGNGTSVVIVRNPQIEELVRAAIAEGRLELREVDAEFVIRTQAAGFRQRREGLAFRLSWPRRGVIPKKRVMPKRGGLETRRMVIYWLRSSISEGSHRVFWLARSLNAPRIYLCWASSMLALYQGVAYSRGWLGAIVDRLFPPKGGEGGA